MQYALSIGWQAYRGDQIHRKNSPTLPRSQIQLKKKNTCRAYIHTKKSSSNMCRALLKVFNACLHNGTYPWNTSYVTPLHKTGSIYDPNNYRAIAVGSSLGKLFSSILLGRLLSFRGAHAPNPKNQLGFCAGGQTSDDILTLSTCIQKYVRHRKERLYTCFVDFRKAFDSVSRQALVYKLNKLGIKGRFLSVLKHMYSNSPVRIKLLQKLSDKIDILAGTEQGHPMSPELFKVYAHDLSLELDKTLNELNVPVLDGNKITHLLYADDLIMFALDESSITTEFTTEITTSKTRRFLFSLGIDSEYEENRNYGLQLSR